jgi:hypothetical protein
MMHRYRLYCLDKRLHIVNQREFAAEDDDAAIASVRVGDRNLDREIWENHRKVAVIQAELVD